MAYFVEAHYNQTAACHVPAYWTPEGTVQRMPCDTKEEAEKLEEEFSEDWEADFNGQ